MWNVNSHRLKSNLIIWLLCGNLLLICGVKATYNSGVKTTIYTSDPQITTQTYTTHHRNYVPVSGDYHNTHSPNNLENNGNDNDYQMTVTHHSRGSSPQWTSQSSSHTSNSNTYRQQQQQQQHDGSYQYNHHHQQQQQRQPQPIYERQTTGHASHQQTSGRVQQTENDITDYYTGCPSGHTGQLPYAYDCRRFLNCWKGRGHIQSCSVGTVFNPETLECDRPDKVKCAAGLPGSQAQTKTTHGHLTQSATSPNRAGRYIDEATESVDMLCPAGSQGLEPHPTDCTKFINCANGNVHIQECGPGTAFSIPMKVCDFKDKVDCSGRTETADSHVHVQDRELGVSCGPGTFGIYPHPQDCHKFMRCSNGRIAIENCPPGQVFSVEKSSCHVENDVPQYDRSSYVNTQTQGQGQAHYNVGGRGSTTTTKTATTNNNYNTGSYHTPLTSDVNCPSPNANGRYPHPYDCTKFVMCSNGVAHIQSCGPGTAWNGAMEVCDFMDKVDCSPSQATVTTTTTTGKQQPEINCPPGAEGLFMHPYDWHKYLSCTNGYTHIMDCGPGTVFSVTRKVCDLERNVANTDRCNNGVYTSNYDYSYTQGFNNQGSTPYGHSNNKQWSHTTVTQHQPQPPSTTYTQTHTTTHQGTGGGGDRWTNMNIPRPQVSSYDQQTTGWQPVPNRPVTTNVWSGTAINVDKQTPTHTVIYEEGSLRPDSNYNQHTFKTSPLAPLPGTGSTTGTTSTVVYAQPIGSQEASEEVFGNSQAHAPQYPFGNSQPYAPQYPIPQNTYQSVHPLTPNFNRQNFTRTIHFMPPPGNTWTPIVSNGYPQVPIITHLMPPLQEPTQPVDKLMPPFRKEPQGSWYPLPDNKQPSNYPTSTATPSSPGVDIPITHLMPPNYSPLDKGQRPLTETDPVVTTINIDDYPGQLWPGYDSNQLEPLPSGSRKVVTVHETNLFGGLQPPFSDSTTPRNVVSIPDRKTQIPPPSKTTTPIPSLIHNYPKLSNATIQTFPNQPHYSSPYSEVAHSRNASRTAVGRKIPQQSAIKPTNRLEISKKPNSPSEHEEDSINPENLPLKEALQLMLRPYLNASGSVDEDIAAKAESHIMNLVAPVDRRPEQTTTTSTHNPLHANSVSTPPSYLTTTPQDDVELIIAGEQHSLVTTNSVQPGAHKSGTFFDFQHTTVESQRSTNSHDHDQNNWHKHHQHTPSSSKHHQHSREFHEKHPNLPNPFDAPLESAGIDVRINDNSCPFNCGNGKCIAQHEVCNGVNNCGNRKDEEQCDHLGYEVRLTGGESSNKGRVEVKILGKWGYVCDDKFGLKDADVVCRELGFKMGAMEVRGSSYYPPSDTNAAFNMDEVECKGNETSLRECDFKGWGVNNCGPDEVVGVVCKVQQLKCPDNYWLCTKSEECIPTAFLCDVTPDCTDGSDESPEVCNAPIEYRLEGGRTKNEGRLEIFYRGEWGTVCDDDFGLKEAQVVCNSLGFYGKAQVAKNIYGPGSGPIWLDQVSCMGNETTLDKCNHWTWGENNCQHTEDVGIKCTAGPKPTIIRPVTTTTAATTLSKDIHSEYELSELDDLGKYQGLWQRSSKAVHQPRQCGHFKMNLVDEYAHPEERVINGSIAKRGRHPWQATIRTRGRGGISSHWCGAVIISKKLILTAAHCLAGYPKGSYFVRVGDHYANIAESSEVDSNIENWYIHERFREEKHMNNDIALILLKNGLRFNDYVQPICLPEKGSQLQANRKCTISGWGSIKSGTSTPSNILRAAEVPILADDVCRRKNVYGNAMSEGMFCAGFLDENVDACDGDSGGPLVCSDDGGETLYGIISWGQHCGYANHPGVYVRVEKYIDWIYEKINLMIQQGKL
ncbi:tequila isoform X2 [Musca autumnalis]|uniref:tequila isoform X2 n=1 Tax=Musca autumnalis TaxID=221902 RepID=UPI003CE6F42F